MVIDNGSETTAIQGLPISTYIDSLVPEIWLPIHICAAFESAFGLTWNDTAEMYLINETLHPDLLSDASVAFSFAADTTSTGGVQITVPYKAFDLAARAPLAGIEDDSSLRYFPLKRAANENQYYLGRTFLQFAYVICGSGKPTCNYEC